MSAYRGKWCANCDGPITDGARFKYCSACRDPNIRDHAPRTARIAFNAALERAALIAEAHGEDAEGSANEAIERSVARAIARSIRADKLPERDYAARPAPTGLIE